MRYEKTITINKAAADMINRYLTIEPTCADECLGEDETIIYTAVFDNGFEVDIKCCGVQYREDEDCNTAWCEAVLFKNGNEICCVYGEDDFLGEWELEYGNDEYVVIVEVDTH